jgi:hypothetical protein
MRTWLTSLPMPLGRPQVHLSLERWLSGLFATDDRVSEGQCSGGQGTTLECSVRAAIWPDGETP